MRLVLVVTDAEKPAANAWIKANVPYVSGDDFFTVRLNDNGDDAAQTHWMSCWGQLTPDQFKIMRKHFKHPHRKSYVSKGRGSMNARGKIGNLKFRRKEI